MQAVSAVAYLHNFDEAIDESGKAQKGLLHRDLKPGNIFLHFLPGSKMAILQIGDLGLARTLDNTKHLASTRWELLEQYWIHSDQNLNLQNNQYYSAKSFKPN